MFTQTLNGQVVGQQSRGLAVGYPDELRLRPTNRDLLRSIAKATGGQFDAGPVEVAKHMDAAAIPDDIKTFLTDLAALA